MPPPKAAAKLPPSAGIGADIGLAAGAVSAGLYLLSLF